jgi:carbon monoxide dehydrogenase subunit G
MKTSAGIPGTSCRPASRRRSSSDSATLTVKYGAFVCFGPVLLNFKGKLIYKEVDEANHRVVAEASGSETKARGTAQANVAFALVDAAEGTRVLVDTDVQLAGSIAQYGRGAALIQNTAQVIMNEFARNFAAQLGPHDDTKPEAPDSAKPISGFKVLLHGVRNTIKG